MLVLITLSCQHFQVGTSDGVATMLVETIFAIIFIFFPFSLFHSLLRPFLTEGVFGSKEWFGAANDLGLDPFSDPGGHFGDPYWPFLILQAVSKCPRRRYAGILYDFYQLCPWFFGMGRFISHP